MGIFDALKRQAANAARTAGRRAVSDLGQAARTAAKTAACRSWTFTFEHMPASVAELQQLPEAALKEPQDTAALTVAALCRYPFDPEACYAMLDYLRGPRPMTGNDRQFLRDRFLDKPYIAASFLEGASPENNYQPTVPFTVRVSENPYSRDQADDGYVMLYLQSGGADSPRPVKLRLKPSTGQWFLWEQLLLSGIRQPAAQDPWA